MKKYKYVSVDVEADAESPLVGSMVCFGAVIVGDQKRTFKGMTQPVMQQYNPEALAVSGFTREKHLEFDHPKDVMMEFAEWLEENIEGRPVFISDNPAFDWQWINGYFHKYLGWNPFGFSARRIILWSGWGCIKKSPVEKEV